MASAQPEEPDDGVRQERGVGETEGRAQVLPLPQLEYGAKRPLREDRAFDHDVPEGSRRPASNLGGPAERALVSRPGLT